MDNSTIHITKIFKIATVIFLSFPTLLLIVEIIFGKFAFRDVLNLAFIVSILLIIPALAIFFSSLLFIDKYNQLFCTTSNREATTILQYPFTPTIYFCIFVTISSAIFMPFLMQLFFIGLILLLTYTFVLAVMSVILISLRKKFKDKVIPTINSNLICKQNIPEFPNFDKNALSSREESFTCPLTTEQVDEKMCNLSAHGISFNLIGRNILLDGFEYSLSVKINFFSFGERMYVKCIQNNTGSFVTVFSKCVYPLQVSAWGKHAKNIDKIKNLLLR